jgi:proteasome accessory factor A
MLKRMFTDEQVSRAVSQPPDDTRAYFRGECLRRYPDAVAAASWDSVVFDIPGQAHLMRVATLEPARGTRQHVADLLDECATAEELLTALSASPCRVG